MPNNNCYYVFAPTYVDGHLGKGYTVSYIYDLRADRYDNRVNAGTIDFVPHSGRYHQTPEEAYRAFEEAVENVGGAVIDMRETSKNCLDIVKLHPDDNITTCNAFGVRVGDDGEVYPYHILGLSGLELRDEIVRRLTRVATLVPPTFSSIAIYNMTGYNAWNRYSRIISVREGKVEENYYESQPDNVTMTRAELDELLEQKYQYGFQQGYQRGYDEGEDSGLKELSESLYDERYNVMSELKYNIRAVFEKFEGEM